MTSFQPAHPGQANSDVTYSCSRPDDYDRIIAEQGIAFENFVALGDQRAEEIGRRVRALR